MQYKVTKQFGRGSEVPVGNYRSIADAQTVVNEKLSEDVAMKIKTIYRIYEWDEVIETHDPDQVKVSSSTSPEESAQGQGKTSAATFKPTPMATSPRPPGMLANWWKEGDEDKDKDKGK